MDGIILGVAQWILITPLLGAIGFGAYKAAQGDLTQSEAIGMVGAVAGTMVVTWLVTIVIAWLYFALMESSKLQATIGKMVVGAMVTDLEGNRISFGRATGRYFGKILSGIILLIGYIMAGFTEKKQALHDMLAGTLVWKK